MIQNPFKTFDILNVNGGETVFCAVIPSQSLEWYILRKHEAKTSVTLIMMENRLVPLACICCYDLENN